MSDRNYIVTGKTNTAHISSADDGSLYGSLFGGEDYVLTTLNENPLDVSFAGQTVTIGAGDFVMQGRYGRVVEPDNIIIETPSAGTARYSDVCIQYLHNIAEDTEEMKLVVINGQEKAESGDPAEPVLTKGNIFNGDTQRDVRLCRVLADTRSGSTVFTLITDGMFEWIPLNKVYIQVDDHFDPNSPNPIMNKVVAALLQEVNKANITQTNIVCQNTWWHDDTTHLNYRYRCDIPIEGCTEDYFPLIAYSDSNPYKSEICQVPETREGYVSIWTKQLLSELTIQSVLLVRRINYAGI